MVARGYGTGHLAFAVRSSDLDDRILIPKYYDPDLEAEIELAGGKFELPELGEVLYPGSDGSSLGNWIRRRHYGSGNIPYVRTSDLSHWRIRPDFKKGVSEEVYKRLEKKQDVRANDLLMVAHGTYLVGNVAIVAEGEERLVLQDHVFRLRPDPKNGVHPYLLLACLSTRFVRRQVRSRQFSADIIDKLGDRHLGIRVPIPKDKAIREKVVERVGHILSEQTDTREAIESLAGARLRMLPRRAESRYAFAVKRSGIRRRILVPKYYDPELEAEVEGAEKAADLPWVSLRKLVKDGHVSVETGVEVGKMAYGTGDIPFIRTSDLLEWEVRRDAKHSVGQHIYDQYTPRGTLAANDILVVRDGTYLVGSSAIVTDDDIPAMFCGGLYRIRVREDSEVSPFSLLAFLNLPVVRRQMRARQFTRDVIDTLGKRLFEVKMPSPFGEDAADLGERVNGILDRKAAVKRDIGEAVEVLEPEIPTSAFGRPGWSMRA